MSSSWSRRRRLILRILISATAVLLLAMLIFQAFGVEYSRKYIVNKVQDGSYGRYVLTLDDLDFSVLGGRMQLKGVEFQRDSTVERYSGQSLLDEFDIHVTFTSLEVTAFKLLRFALFNRVNVSDLHLLDPLVKITKNRDYIKGQSSQVEVANDDATVPGSEASELADSLALQELKEATKEFFPPISVENLSILNGNFAFYDGAVDYAIQKANGLNLVLKGVYYEDGKRIYTADDLSFEVDSASTLVSQNMAKLNFQGLHVSTTAIHIDRLHYGHVIGPAAVNRIKGFRASWLNIDVSHIELPIVDVEKMIEDSSLLIPMLAIENVDLHFYKHKYEKRINPAYKALPQELILDIPLRFALDSLVVDNASVHIEMLAEDARHTGHLTLDTSKLTVTNMTNIPARLNVNPVMELDLTTKLMREAPAGVNFKFDLTSSDLSYNTVLKAGPMRADVLNDFLGSQFFIEFRSGYIQEIDLRYHGNMRANVGEMNFAYTNLRLRQIDNAEKYVEGGANRKFLSGIANIIIPKNNTPDMKKYFEGLVYYEREYNRDFMHGMIMSLVSGLMSTLGLGNQKEDKIQKKLDALDDQSMQESAIKAQQKADQADVNRINDSNKQQRQQQKEIDKAEKEREKKKKQDEKVKKKNEIDEY